MHFYVRRHQTIKYSDLKYYNVITMNQGQIPLYVSPKILVNKFWLWKMPNLSIFYKNGYTEDDIQARRGYN